MNDKRPWFYAVFIIVCALLISYVTDVKSNLVELAALKVSKKTLSQALLTLHERQQDVMTKHATMPEENNASQKEDQPALTASLLSLLQQSGLMVQSIDTPVTRSTNSVGVEFMRVVLQGSFSQLAAFLLSLPGQSHPILMTDFSMKAGVGGREQISMDIMQAAVALTYPQSSLASFSASQNPFCLSPNAIALHEEDATKNLQLPNINQIKMIGYLQQGLHAVAFVKLPNNSIAEISSGSVLGKERAVVYQVLRDKVVLTLPDNKRVELNI